LFNSSAANPLNTRSLVPSLDAYPSAAEGVRPLRLGDDDDGVDAAVPGNAHGRERHVGEDAARHHAQI
jgi:hypothetical protein